jgi:hypothetical protein
MFFHRGENHRNETWFSVVRKDVRTEVNWDEYGRKVWRSKRSRVDPIRRLGQRTRRFGSWKARAYEKPARSAFQRESMRDVPDLVPLS